jgi:hypothetical protein
VHSAWIICLLRASWKTDLAGMLRQMICSPGQHNLGLIQVQEWNQHSSRLARPEYRLARRFIATDFELSYAGFEGGYSSPQSAAPAFLTGV